ncbi:hypothetical protein AJ79_05469 [Helicocarpus griseus UAMH5409]|uniref:Uncharacterized protein n=1 Tax=Helicocarpus griseus UAMH5409 TaxID=1447875 RepID=A0A2B7XEX9_9EURO|nr:hypothetical protein AJ79_05469 [Helicocarpus griseus UAMH5409]
MCFSGRKRTDGTLATKVSQKSTGTISSKFPSLTNAHSKKLANSHFDVVIRGNRTEQEQLDSLDIAVVQVGKEGPECEDGFEHTKLHHNPKFTTTLIKLRTWTHGITP